MATKKEVSNKNLNIHNWWESNSREKYWLEVTGRSDIGSNLKAPQKNENDKDFWSYSLIKHINSGDVVYHYDRNKQAIVARSVATGELWEDSIVWAARGALAREAGIHPHKRPGCYFGLENFKQLETPLELEIIRIYQREILECKNKLLSEFGNSLYFPFEISKLRPIRPMQGYLFKLPLFFVELFMEVLSEETADKKQVSDATWDSVFGSKYRTADENTAVGERDPFSVDPSLVERGLHGHAFTQNLLADFVIENGFTPLSPKANDPNFDLGWKVGENIWVAEIKSITHINEEKQLRLGLGQVLRYCYLLKSRGSIHGVLVLEKEPSDSSWVTLCEEHGILLVWPGNWNEKLLR